jgi:hypothetical protein
MARITPKTNWIAGDIPVAPDFNRIENNNEQAFTELDQEVSDRQSAITAEQNARIAADNTLQLNIDNANSARIAGDNLLDSLKISKTNLGSRLRETFILPVSSSSILPPFYGFLTMGADVVLEIYSSSSSWDSISANYRGFVISDGSNLRVRNTSSLNAGVYTTVKI